MPDSHGKPSKCHEWAVRRIAELSELAGLALQTGRHLGPVLLVFILLPVGLIVLAVGLGRAGVLPYWLALLMPIGMAGIAGSLQYPVALVLSGSPLVASFGFAISVNFRLVASRWSMRRSGSESRS
jgi:hypothetical protein